MTDRYLCSLWSQAVRTEKGDACYNPLCMQQAHSVHHIIKRRYVLTRYDERNGVPLCAECHKVADRNSAFALGLIPEEDRWHLQDMGMHTLKDWLLLSGQTRDEFLTGEADRLKRIIRGEE